MISNRLPSSSSRAITTNPIPEGVESLPPIVPTHFSGQFVIPFIKNVRSLMMWTLAALSSTNVDDALSKDNLSRNGRTESTDWNAVLIVRKALLLFGGF